MTTALWTPQRPFRLMVAITVAIALICPYNMMFGSPGIAPAKPVIIPLLLGAGVVALQLRHSVAASRGDRPRGGIWTLLALAVLVYAPLFWYTFNWAATQVLFIASAVMVLRRRELIVVATAGPVLGTVLYFPLSYGPRHHLGGTGLAFEIAFWGTSLLMSSAVVYGAARMVRAASELQAARTDLAELAIARERLRVSRDLHDLIGQSLSAVSLRGDLALRLLDRDPRAAETEIATLTATARDALSDVLTVTRDSGPADLGTEADGARTLLAAAGIDVTVELVLADLPLAARTVFAWALREGVTNVLRHSQAGACSISATHLPAGTVRLEIINDGVPEQADGTLPGNGLTGLAERASTFAGQLTAGPLPGGRFRLCVEVPEEAP